VPVILRKQLADNLGDNVLCFKAWKIQESTQVSKLLFELEDDNKIEAVHMSFLGGKTSLCISSQVGCALKCSFCSTGAIGFKRQLTPDEITDQVLYFLQQGRKVDSISFMGMGEPLMNPKVFEAIEMLTDPNLFNIAQRKLSVSTVGIIPGIERLTKEFPQVNLAFSLHSPFPEQRDELVPANKNYPLNSILPVLEKHALMTNRKIFFAYLVLDGFNDSEEHAKAVISIIAKMDKKIRHLFHVNLLRYNPAYGIAEQSYERTEEPNLKRFMNFFSDANIPVTARRSFGVDIDAACGQLFARYSPKPPRVMNTSTSNPVLQSKT